MKIFLQMNPIPRRKKTATKHQFIALLAREEKNTEKVVQQNQYDETVWPLALRTAVVGSNLEASSVSMGGTYEEIKRSAFSTRSDCRQVV